MEQVERILMLLKQGMTREQIAEQERIKTSSLNQRMRRAGLRWDDVCKDYVPAVHPPGQHVVNGKLLPPRIVHVVSMFRMVTSDPKEVAKLAHYKDEQDMARDMKEHGMVWSSAEHNYIPADKVISKSTFAGNTNLQLPSDLGLQVTAVPTKYTQGASPFDGFEPIEIPRYRTGARRAPKTLVMALNLQQLLVEISARCNIAQGEVMEVAFVDFCMKYGFKEEISSILIKSTRKPDYTF